MPKNSKKTSSRKKRTTKAASRRTKAKTSTARHAAKPRAPRRKSGGRGSAGETFVFECTRLGCGYRIVRDEKAEIGAIRVDLKCPKCHHSEFKCLGKGDLPESIEMTFPTASIDFDNMNPLDLSSK